MVNEEGDKTFIRITNKVIYDEIIGLKDYVKSLNGRISVNRWIGTTALSISLLILGFLLKMGIGK